MGSIKDAEQKYKEKPEIVHAFAQKDLSPNKRYVKKMCDLYFEEHIPFEDVCNLFAAYEANKGIFDAVGLDFNHYPYQQLFELVYKASGDYADKCKLPNEIVQSNDKTVSLGLFKTFEEAMKFEGENSWCTGVNQSRFDENTANGTLLYIIRNLRLSKGSECRFVVAQVFNNGEKIYWTSKDNKLSEKHDGSRPSIVEYENSIKEILPYIKPTNNNLTESKTNKNMKKNIVKINENTLRQIVAESVKKVLNEYAEGNEMSPVPGDNYSPTPQSLIQTIIDVAKNIDVLLESVFQSVVKNDTEKARKGLSQMGQLLDVVLDRASELQGFIEQYSEGNADY